MPSAWPLCTVRPPVRKADALLDTTCFSTSDFDNLIDAESDSSSEPNPSSTLLYLLPPTNMFKNPQAAQAEVIRRNGLSNAFLEVGARYNHPTLPSASFPTTLTQPDRFAGYIAHEFFSSPNASKPIVSTTNQEPVRKEVNATVANSLLNTAIPTSVTTLEWASKILFPDECLPVPFRDDCLDTVGQCWDKVLQKFSHFPDTAGEKQVQDWLNHLAHALGVQHGLFEDQGYQEAVGIYQEEEIKEKCGIQNVDYVGLGNATQGVERKGKVVASAQDRSFSMVSHKKAPTGGYRLRKPDLILFDRSLRHLLKKAKLRPRWNHVQAIVEISLSATRDSILQQILEKAALMFQAQPFRRYAIGLAFRGDRDFEFSFLLIDRAGLCLTEWCRGVEYYGIGLARIIFALAYASPEVLGVDTSMTIDPLSGSVTKIRVKGQEFEVVKLLHSSLTLFSRGTHVFLVKDQHGEHHILKHAWILTEHGLSEIDALSTIKDTLNNDTSAEAQKLRSIHPRFVIGEEIGDSTTERRGRLSKLQIPPERVHRRVVSGPVGDPLTSFRSRAEFIQVLLDCVDWLEFLHTKCEMVHGDISINNIVIHRAPSLASPDQVSVGGVPLAQPAVPPEGLQEGIPVTGSVIDYDYARKLGTIMAKTSGTLPFMPLASLDRRIADKYVHGPAEDLESLLHTIITIVTFTAGPCGQVRMPKDHIPAARWHNEIDREQLRKDKAIDLIAYEKEMQPYIAEYWQSFSPYLHRLIKATWTSQFSYQSVASHREFREILQEALQYFNTDPQLEEAPCHYARFTLKRGRPPRDDDRYPYKNHRRDDDEFERLPRNLAVKEVSEWKDSVDG